MNVVITTATGIKTYANYSPEHEIGIVQFYANALASGDIRGYIIRDNNSGLVARGGSY